MPLLDEKLSLWEVGFRWADLDPHAMHFRIPTAAKDNFRVLLRAIDGGHLYCDSLKVGNYAKQERTPEFRLDSYRRAVDECIEGIRYDKKLLKRASLFRWEFAQWCDKEGLPYPEFWFPHGYSVDEAGYPKALRERHKAPRVAVTAPVSPGATEVKKKSRSNDAIWRGVFAAAAAIWRAEGPIPSAQVARRIKEMKISGARFSEEAIRKRIAPRAPEEIRGKAGAPKKKLG